MTSWAISRAMAVRFPSLADDAVGWVTADEMRRIDRAMVSELGITLVQMMENAGRSLARLVQVLTSPASVAVYAGVGGNGGGGLVAARHLANHGVDVTVVLNAPVAGMALAPRMQLQIVEQLGIPVVTAPSAADVAVDALVGYALRGPLDDDTATLARAMRTNSSTVISLDVPTGLDASTGIAVPSAVIPDATMTLCLPKRGLAARSAVGELFLADISVPPALAERISRRAAPPFATSSILRLVPRRPSASREPGS